MNLGIILQLISINVFRIQIRVVQVPALGQTAMGWAALQRPGRSEHSLSMAMWQESKTAVLTGKTELVWLFYKPFYNAVISELKPVTRYCFIKSFLLPSFLPFSLSLSPFLPLSFPSFFPFFLSFLPSSLYLTIILSLHSFMESLIHKVSSVPQPLC